MVIDARERERCDQRNRPRLMDDHDVRSEARAILEARGLPGVGLTHAGGFANAVLLTDRHVIRLNGGRFPGAFAHEASVLRRLPGDIPHPVPIAWGTRASSGEYLILERLPGANLDIAWPAMSAQDRQTVGRELGAIIGALHSLPVMDWMRNPWVERALEIGAWRDAYHAPPDRFEAMIASARERRPDLRTLLAGVARFVAERRDAFDEEPSVFTHTDLHFGNIIVDEGHVSGLIDFEGSRIGPRDVELDMLLRSMASDDPDSPDRRSLILGPMADACPDLFSRQDLLRRLEVQEALWLLVQIHHWRPGQRWMEDPGTLLERLMDGAFRARTVRLLAPVPPA